MHSNNLWNTRELFSFELDVRAAMRRFEWFAVADVVVVVVVLVMWMVLVERTSSNGDADTVNAGSGTGVNSNVMCSLSKGSSHVFPYRKCKDKCQDRTQASVLLELQRNTAAYGPPLGHFSWYG